VDRVLCVDVGSTFTKAVLVDPGSADVLGTASTPTTMGTDVLDGYRTLLDRLDVPDGTLTLACSSAGGGLRLGVIGYERQVTAEAGHRVGLSAGAKVVHVSAGRLDGPGVAAVRAARPDILLLVGGTDGGNADVLLHNATRLARARLPVPVVVAGNQAAREEVGAVLETTRRRHVLAGNVVPEIGVIAPDSARSAIRAAFLEHVIGGKGLSRDPLFTRIVRAPTPDAVLRGVEVLAEAQGVDALVVDIGGATTDVYSCLTPEGEDATLRKDVVGPLWHARTVEADLGMRWNAEGIIEAAGREGLATSDGLAEYAGSLAERPAHLPSGAAERRRDLELARLAAVVAVRRHGRPGQVGEAPRPLGNVGLVLGSGGVLRHNAVEDVHEVLEAVTSDHGGGWKVPRGARAGVDTAYLLFAVGLLAEQGDGLAGALAQQIVDG